MRTRTFNKLPEKRQHAILDAAARIFSQKGYFQAGISEICQAAEISNGALYKYFENKKGLFIAVLYRAGELMLTEAIKIAGGKMVLWDRLRMVVESVIPFSEKYRDYLVIFMDLGSPSMDEFASEASGGFERATFGFFKSIVEEARNNGQIRQDISTETAAYFIDNHLMLFAFSCVSNYHDDRFCQFFGNGVDRLKGEQKIELIMRSFKELLG